MHDELRGLEPMTRNSPLDGVVLRCGDNKQNRYVNCKYRACDGVEEALDQLHLYETHVPALLSSLDAAVKERDAARKWCDDLQKQGRTLMEERDFALDELDQFRQHGTPDGFATAIQSSLDNFNRAKEAEKERDELRKTVDQWIAKEDHYQEMCGQLDAAHQERDELRERCAAAIEDFADYVCTGTQNPAPFCANACRRCNDARGWCKLSECEGFQWRGPQKGAEHE